MRSQLRTASAVALLAVSSIVLAQYRAIVLPQPQEFQWSIGGGAGSGVFGGYAVVPGNNGLGFEHAALWANGVFRDVTPQGYVGIIGDSRGGQHVGRINTPQTPPKAFLWDNNGNGTLLHPPGYTSSECLGVGGGKQVGQLQISSNCFECGYYVERHPVLWSGTAGSFQLIHTPGFGEVRLEDTDGTRHVGSSYTDKYQALLVNAGVLVNLHPAGFAGSFARAVYGNDQVGFGETASYDLHALLWHGSAGSVVDLHPSGYSLSVTYGVAPGVQVGAGRTIVPGPDRALAWKGSAQSVVDLHTFLPPGFRAYNSFAEDVDEFGNIVGTCGEDATGSPRAVVWVPDRRPIHIRPGR